MIIKINKSTFEKHIPAFRSSTEEVFKKCETFLEQSERWLLHQIGGVDHLLPDTDQLEQAVHLICLRAASMAIPSMDLVLTSTGFGIVSNQNVAPASRERVEALLASVQSDEAIAFSRLIESLKTTNWKDSTHALLLVSSLLYTPERCNVYGYYVQNGKMTMKGFYAALPNIQGYEEMVKSIISPELHSKMLDILRVGFGNDGNNNKVYLQAIELSSRLIALMSYSDKSPSVVLNMKDRLLRYVESHLNELPEYKDSSTYKAHHTKTYENKKSDSTFFFG